MAAWKTIFHRPLEKGRNHHHNRLTTFEQFDPREKLYTPPSPFQRGGGGRARDNRRTSGSLQRTPNRLINRHRFCCRCPPMKEFRSFSICERDYAWKNYVFKAITIFGFFRDLWMISMKTILIVSLYLFFDLNIRSKYG